MLKVIFIWFAMIMSSPIIVDLSKDIYQETGWLAIGRYNFNFIDGMYRSFIYFMFTFPVIQSIYMARPVINKINNYSRSKNLRRLKGWTLLVMSVSCLIAFIFNLGITGVETDTNGFHLSGIVHYIRSYLFLLVVALYVFLNKSPSTFLVIFYAFVAGITSGSRFVIVSPIIMLIARLIYNKNNEQIKIISCLVFVVIIFFILVSIERQILYVYNYSFFHIYHIISMLDLNMVDMVVRGINELFLRLGLGRDVILAYEVKQANVCSDYYDLFFNSGACIDPSFDFYGFVNDQTRFGLSPPQISSMVASLQSNLYSPFILFGYCCWSYVLCISIRVLTVFPLGKYFLVPSYYFQAVFILIGPIKYAIVLVSVSLILSFFYKLSWRCFRRPRL